MKSWTENQGQPMFGQYNLTKLEIDQAWLNISNLLPHNLYLYQLSKNCLQCPFVKNTDFSQLEPSSSAKFIVSTKYPITYRLERSSENDVIPENDTRSMHCNIATNMGEFGVYEMVVNDNGCELTTALEPVSIYFPILIPAFFYLALSIICILWQKYGHQVRNTKLWFFTSAETKETILESSTPLEAPVRPRLRSLDTFRGLCITIMMFVHDGSAGYYFMDHATWDGLYVADLVFPWFLWIMGVCIPVSIKSQVKKSIPKVTIFRRIVIRSIKLAGIGLLLNSRGGPVEWSTFRFPGVLQRFSLCYLVAATMVLICADENFVNNRKSKNKYVMKFQDIFFIWKGWLITICAVILHTCLTFLLPVPDCPSGYLGPGGLHDGNLVPAKCVGGASGYIDRQILGAKHIFQWPTAKEVYGSEAYDPEGLLGNLTAILTVWLGVQTGLTLQVFPKHKSRVVRWAVWAVVTGAIGVALSGAKQTGGVIPLNKNLWSLSFVLSLGSLALVLLIALYLLIDVWNVWSGTPFFEPGMNSMLLYVAHLVAQGMLPWHWGLKRMNTHFKKLVETLWGISLWVVYSIYLFRIKYFWNL